jgi:hypothetical protein
MDPLPYVFAQVRLEYDLDPQSYLLPRPDSSEQARYIVYVYPGGCRAFWQATLPAATRLALAALDPLGAFEHPEGVVPLLGQPAARPSGVFRAYTLLAPPGPEEYPLVELAQRLVCQDGRVVAAA